MTQPQTLPPSQSAPPPTQPSPLTQQIHKLLGPDRPKLENLLARTLGISLMALAAGLLISLLVEWGSTSSHAEGPLLASTAACAAAGGVLAFFSREPKSNSKVTMFATVAWTWLICSVVGALPYFLDTMSWDNALFESVSGFSCTGSTVMADIEAHGRGILMWRQITQWFGGMGMVVLALVVLSSLRVGGMELMSAEAPGDSDRLAPSVRRTAGWLWTIYAGLTAAVALVLFAVPGAGLYDSAAHSLTIVATGGFSPYNASIGHFDSWAIELVVALGLLLCAVSFTLHHKALSGIVSRRAGGGPRRAWGVSRRAISRPDLSGYRKSADTMFFFKLVGAVVALAIVLNVLLGDAGWLVSARDSFFNVVSLATSGGFANVRPGDPDGIGDFALWVPSTQLLLLGIMVVGGNVGSTSGGLKAFRGRIAALHIWRNVRQTIQPGLVLPIRSTDAVIPEDTVRRVLGFTTLYVLLLGAGSILVALLGADLLTSLSGTLSAMSNMGPALGEAGPTSNFLVFSRPARLVLAAFMLIGRLEIMAILFMFTPAYRFLLGERSR